ncbi:xyloglucan endotransglucosylase/hydrolase protein 2-like [Malania oleifera]|uniref:xyloglucan endotransglucosylase/hydrolase protein 2-like n=1 Tax=Malania oleifera TaxID=397392 RepID=UPI0025AE7B28|nr:xyloglucan endotransglucosylase/hydrolase protein 2-like [Malania oleifera]
MVGLIAFLLVATCRASNANIVSFDQNYEIIYGNDHIAFLNNQRTEIQLSFDQSSGSGFGSKESYGSGFFRMRMQIPDKDSSAIVTTFYVTSHTSNHDELDFEFLGNSTRPYTLQTNIYSNGIGEKEQRVLLWFDPTTDFHTYEILWNEKQVVFFVDGIPIRVFKNNAEIGVSYPSQPMQTVGTIWMAEWASNGKPPNWADAPFKAQYQGFNIDGCQAPGPTVQPCSSSNYWWNGEKYWKLDSNQQTAYEAVRRNNLIYDYCSDHKRYPQSPAECQSNQ